MKKRMTRRRSALRWTALAVALILSWGIAKDYCFTPWQARRHWWKLTDVEGMEQVAALEKIEHRYIKVIGGNDYEHWALFSNGELMSITQETFDYRDGWVLCGYSRTWCTPENAQVLPEGTLWTDEYYYFSGGGCLCFRADNIRGEVTGFSLAEAIEAPDGTVTYGLSDELMEKVDFRGRTRISREELCYDSQGHAYGMFDYELKDGDYDDEVAQTQWYLRLELADGGERVIPFHSNQVIRSGGDGTNAWRSG